jgi:two-component system chemotaxis sensor kinase CheA
MENMLVFEIEAGEEEFFVQDVNEHLQAIETGILRLEQCQGQTDNLDTINAVFRAAHTLKSVASTVGHHRMTELTHSVETLFDGMRQGHFQLTPAIADELLCVLDVLRDLRDEVVNQRPSGIDVDAVLCRLHAVMDEVASGPGPLVTQGGSQGEPAHYSLTPEQVALAQGYAQAGHKLLEIQATASANAFAPAARLLQATLALAEVGQVVAQQPSQAELANDQHQGGVWLILAAQDEGAVEESLRGVSELAAYHVRPFRVSGNGKEAPAPRPYNGRATDQTVRISVERLDSLMNLVGELVTDRTRLVQIEQALRARYGQDNVINALDDMTGHLNRVVDRLQAQVMQARMLPLAQLFKKFPRLVRDTARAAGKEARLVIEGGSTELDRSIIEAIGDPLAHLLRNAVDHGLESPQERLAAGKQAVGTVWLTAKHAEGHIVVTVQDDGRGIDLQRIRRAAVQRGLLSEQDTAKLDDDQAMSLVFRPGLSTIEQATETSGRGVGLDVVQTNVKRLNGSVLVESKAGQGATFCLTLPLTLAIVQAMLVGLGDDVYAIPLTSIIESLYMSDVGLCSVKGHPLILWREQTLPLLDLRQIFAHPRLGAPADEARQAIVAVAWGKLRAGLVVDQLIGKQEIVVKSLGSLLGSVTGLSGCTVLGDGRIALIVDIPSLVSSAVRAQKSVK